MLNTTEPDKLTTMLNTTEPDKLTYPKRPPYLSIRVSQLSRQFRIAAYPVWFLAHEKIAVVIKFEKSGFIIEKCNHKTSRLNGKQCRLLSGSTLFAQSISPKI